MSTYKLLKDKYAGQLVANWSESSDPEKSVHEDIGIAAYLSCLWGDKKVFIHFFLQKLEFNYCCSYLTYRSIAKML